MRLSRDQIAIISKYCADLSKILVASAVIGFFIPTGAGPISFPTFLVGSLAAVFSLWVSVRLA